MAGDLQQLTEQMLDAARHAGADAADAIAVSDASVSVDVLNGRLEHAERSESTEIGLRVLAGRRQACVSSSDLSGETIRQMAERAVAMAREAPEDPAIGLAEADQLARDWDIGAFEMADPAPEPSPTALEEDALAAEAAAYALKGISKVDNASAGYGRSCLHLAASNGFSGGYARTSRSIGCVAITGTGGSMERDHFWDTRVFREDLMPPEEIGRVAAERALARAGPGQPPTGRFPVVFDERVAGSLIGHLLAAVNGTAIARGASWLLDGLGKQVLPKELSLTEEPHRRRARATCPFDGEGLPTRRRHIIENGILCGWTLDLAIGRKLGMESTANARRGTSAPPSPGVGNVTLTQGEKSRDDLLREMGTGLLVTSLIGSTINPNTGDYSRGASGFWVEGGAVCHPVNECTIAGNLRDMLRGMMAANDARTHLSRVVPSLLVEGLAIAGK